MQQGLLRINSFDRNVSQSASNTDFEVNLNNNSRLQQVDAISLKSAHFMNGFANISEYNRTYFFARKEQYAALGTDFFGVEVGVADPAPRLRLAATAPGRAVVVLTSDGTDYSNATCSVAGAEPSAFTLLGASGFFISENDFKTTASNQVTVNFADGETFSTTIAEPEYIQSPDPYDVLPEYAPNKYRFCLYKPGSSSVTFRGEACLEGPAGYFVSPTVDISAYGRMLLPFVVDGGQLLPPVDFEPQAYLTPLVESIQIAVGNYELESFLEAFAQAMADAGIIVTNATQSPLTKKISFETDVELLHYEFVSPSVYNPMAYVLGISNDKALRAPLPPETDYTSNFQADALPDLRGPTEVYLHISPMADAYMNDSFGGIENIADVVAVDAAFGCTVHYYNRDPQSNMIYFDTPVNLSALKIEIKDGFGNILDIGGSSVTLIFTVFYK